MTGGALGLYGSWELRAWVDGRAQLLLSPSLDVGIALSFLLERSDAHLIGRSIVGEIPNGEPVLTRNGGCFIAAHKKLGEWQVLADGNDQERGSAVFGGIAPEQGMALRNALNRFASSGLVGADG